MNSECPLLRKEYESLKTLKQGFDLEYEKATSGKASPKEARAALVRAKKLKAELEQGMDALSAKLWPFEKVLSREGLKNQYDRQKAALERLGILEKLSDGRMGIKAIDNQEYPFPTLPEVMKQMKEKKELLETKIKQGFVKLLITPFGMKLDDLIEKYKQVIWQHYREKKLFATMKNPKDKPAFPADLPFDKDTIAAIKSGTKKYEDVWAKQGDVFKNGNDGLWVWEKCQNADINGELVYYPKEFSAEEDEQGNAKHQGKTKQEALAQTQTGFNIHLIEDLPNIPREGKGQTKAERKQLEAGKKPNQYLEILETAKTDLKSKYHGEEGMTPEDQIIYAIYHLEETNQVIDDYNGNGSVSYLLAAFFPVSGRVPDAYWSRVGRRAYLGGDVPGYSNPDSGVRSAVRISP